MGPDKIEHFAVGAVIAETALKAGFDATTSFLIATAAGAGKEILDIYTNGTPDIADFGATVLGAAVLLLLTKRITF